MPEPLKIIVVDDEQGICLFLKKILSDAGHDAEVFTDPNKALQSLNEKKYDLGIVDIRMPGIDGLTFLKKAIGIDGSLHVIMMTAYGSIENAVESIKMGAFDYITKPFQADELYVIIDKILERKRLIDENTRLRQEIESFSRQGGIVGKNTRIKEIIKIARKVAPTVQSVLITGESGTGKEVLARYIHDESDRRERPFIPVQCNLLPVDLFESELFGHKKGSFTGAITEKNGVLEEADGGTLFLDEIGDIGLDIQGKLLRFLQSHEIRRVGETKTRTLDVRIIFATNKNLEELISRGQFRDDLYYRIKVISIALPPLRERKEDIPLLASFFLDQVNTIRKNRAVMDKECMKQLVSYQWPGNIRELKNCIETASVMCENDTISSDDILNFFGRRNTEVAHAGQTFKELKAKAIGDFETGYIVNLMVSAKGNIAAAAREAGMDRKNFFELLKKYDIKPDSFK